MDALKNAVVAYAHVHANEDGLALTPVPGLRMMCVHAPCGPLHSIYRPLICLILQGAKRMAVGTEERVVVQGESAIVGADLPVSGWVVKASAQEPYLAVAVELDAGLLREIGGELNTAAAPSSHAAQTLLVENTDAAVADCAMRLMRLLDRPDAIALLRPGTVRDLRCWLMCGRPGPALLSLALPEGDAGRLGAAIAMLRADYRQRIPVGRLAGAAAMSLTAFHRRFKTLTSLTPLQFQKHLRLIEARRLMVHEGSSATQAAFEVGYESVSQFTREYARMFGAPPRRDVRGVAVRADRAESAAAARQPASPSPSHSH